MTFQLATIFGFLLVLARVSGIIVLVPIPGFSAGPDTSRMLLALALTVALFPVWPARVLSNPWEGSLNGPASLLLLGQLLGWMAIEAALGLTMGVAIAFLLETVQMAAQILGFQAGYSYASIVDPNTDADTTTLQLMAQLLAGLLFFAFGLDRQVLRVLAKSLAWPQNGVFAPRGSATEAIMRLGALVFSTGLQLAMPVLALLVLLDVAFAVLGRLHAQLQLLSLSFTIKMLVGLAFLASILVVYPGVFERSAERTFGVLMELLEH
ncbi:MAG TPA: flagellar biosynthetic protein FliR [Bryobacteraceae bacterium]|nr:flagellar biosynthetic protein FliR [Bryobacteraceae bacterium]